MTTDKTVCETCKDWGPTITKGVSIPCPICNRLTYPNLGVNCPAGCAVGLNSSHIVERTRQMEGEKQSVSDLVVTVNAEQIRTLVNQVLDDRGITADNLDKIKHMMTSGFDLLEQDPHQFSTRPCQTCNQVSALIGRKFGCVKLRG